VTISRCQWQKSERLDSALEALHGVHEHRGKQLFDLTTTTTVGRRTSTLGSHPPFGTILTDKNELTQVNERRSDVDITHSEKVEKELDTLVSRRHVQRVKSEGERREEELWMESERRHAERRREENRAAWHQCKRRIHVQTREDNRAPESRIRGGQGENLAGRDYAARREGSGRRAGVERVRPRAQGAAECRSSRGSYRERGRIPQENDVASSP
jgi:hypothetical protein